MRRIRLDSIRMSHCSEQVHAVNDLRALCTKHSMDESFAPLTGNRRLQVRRVHLPMLTGNDLAHSSFPYSERVMAIQDELMPDWLRRWRSSLLFPHERPSAQQEAEADADPNENRFTLEDIDVKGALDTYPVPGQG